MWNLRHVQQTILVVAYLRFDFCGWYVFGHLGTYIELNVERWFSTLWLNQKGCHWCFGWGFLRPRNKIRHIIFQDFKAMEPHSVVISIPFFWGNDVTSPTGWPHTQDLEKYKGFEKLGGNRKARCGVWWIKSRYPADYQNSLLNMVTAPVELRCFRRSWKHHGCNLQTDLSTLHLLSAAPCSNFLLVLCTEFVQLIPQGILGQYLES